MLDKMWNSAFIGVYRPSIRSNENLQPIFCFGGLPKTRLSQEKFVSNWSKCFLPPTRARSIIDSDNCTKEDKVAGTRNWSDGTFAIAGKTIDKVQFLLRELGNNEG